MPNLYSVVVHFACPTDQSVHKLKQVEHQICICSVRWEHCVPHPAPTFFLLNASRDRQQNLTHNITQAQNFHSKVFSCVFMQTIIISFDCSPPLRTQRKHFGWDIYWKSIVIPNDPFAFVASVCLLRNLLED